MFGLEVWLIGTPSELDTAASALADIGQVAYHSQRTPLAGKDSGRWRTYARISVVTPISAIKPSNTTSDHVTLPDLAA